MTQVISFGARFLLNAKFRIQQARLNGDQLTVTFSANRSIPDAVLATIKRLRLDGTEVEVTYGHDVPLTAGERARIVVFRLIALYSTGAEAGLDASECTIWFDEHQVEALLEFST